jgi:hypothetical protein
MRLSVPPPEPWPRTSAPLDIYYVVETTPGALGERHHLLSSSLYETRGQAETALKQLDAIHEGTEYAVWKSSTYVEPARWAHDVVLADGTVLRQNASMLTTRS